MALRRATECMAIAGELTGYYEIMMQRIKIWQQTSPGADWDGVWNPSGNTRILHSRARRPETLPGGLADKASATGGFAQCCRAVTATRS